MSHLINNPTIKDVAKKANVSAATVSRILNNLGGYSDETYKKVLDVIDEIGYKRNAIARNLKVRESKAIGVLIPRVETLFYIDILNGIHDFASANDYSVIMCNVGRDGKKVTDYIDDLLERQVDGMIILSLPPNSGFDKKILDSNIPSILVSTRSSRFSIPYVKVDDYLASYTGTNYLIENGHKSIAFIGGVSTDPIAGAPRLEGFLQALKDNNIPVKENLIKHNGFSLKDGMLSMQELIREKEKFTAIFSVCDELAVGAMMVAHREGILIPDDVSIIGFDNTAASQMCYPTLTTIGQPLYEMGQKSTELLIKKISQGENIGSLIMPFEIVERETVRKI